jgi:nonsense-mediated mRNA decay protein 3
MVEMRRCAVCGRQSEHEICAECYLERYSIHHFHPFIELRSCPKCGKTYSGGWKDRAEALYDAISRNFSHDPEFKIDLFEIDDGGNEGLIKVGGEFRGKKLRYELPFDIRQKFEVCEKCSRLHGGYYESIIQLRAENRKIEGHEVERARKLIDEAIEKSDHPLAFVSKVVEKREGIDYYLGDRNLARKVAKRIEEELGGKLTESKKLTGRRDGRDVYRITYSIRLREYRKGDVVRDGRRVLLVTNAVKGKGVDPAGKSHALKRPRLIARREELKHTYVVNVDRSVIEVLNPSTQEVVQVEREAAYGIGERVLYLEHEGRAYVFPELRRCFQQ